MTKIKDLVTVTVDNVFRNFPVDSERYELVGLVVGMNEVSRYNDELPKIPTTIQDERMKLFLEQTLGNFIQGALAMIRVKAATQRDALPLIVYDRARRCSASFGEGYGGLCGELFSHDYVEDIVQDLWSNFLDELVEQHTVYGKPRNGQPILSSESLYRPKRESTDVP